MPLIEESFFGKGALPSFWVLSMGESSPRPCFCRGKRKWQKTRNFVYLMNVTTKVKRMSLLQFSFTNSLIFIQVAIAVFFAILFLQSGLDKVFNWKGNLEWLTGHFAQSPLAGMVPLMLATVTVAEVAAGGLSAAGAVQLLLGKGTELAFWGTVLSAASLLMLFFGQRMAQDYPGAGGLVPYFIVALVGMLMLGA